MPKRMLDKRSFKVSMSSFGIIGGRYISSTPSSAAKKAARILFRQADNGPLPAGGKPPTVSFELRETTRGSKDTVFAYRAARVKRTDPTNFEVNGKPFSIKRTYNITVTAVTEQTMMRSVTRNDNRRTQSRSASPSPSPSPSPPPSMNRMQGQGQAMQGQAMPMQGQAMPMPVQGQALRHQAF